MIGFPPCPECNGWSKVEADRANMGWKPCPSCGGRGVLITDELVEAVAEAIFTFDAIAPKPPYWSDCTPDMVSWYRDAADAALGVVAEELKENR